MAANDYLQKCYINSRYSPTVDEWPPYQPKHYTTLALIHHKDKFTDTVVISLTQELANAGKLQPRAEGLSSSGGSISQAPNIYTKKISDIFLFVTASNGYTVKPSIILIEGAPGIGKTVLAKEIAFQWANNKLLSSKKVLLLLFLRECNFKSITTVEHLVEYVVKSTKIAACLAEYLLQTEGKDLVIVLDGYDEISEEDRKCSIIAHIIYRRIFAKCCLVVTSRPTASSHLHSMVDCRVEIIGFTEEDRLDYIQTALQGDSDKVEALTLYLQSNPTINALCYIPLNMTILLCLVEDGIDKLPKTQTDMYKKFIEMTIVRFIQKLNTNGSIVATTVTKLPHPHNKVFKELSQIAFKALAVDKIVFRIDEIQQVCPNLAKSSSNWNGLGLLKAVQSLSPETGNVTFHFLHFSIQEYMAALCISTLSNSKQIQLLEETFWQQRYFNTWMMYVGITFGSSFAFKHFVSGNRFQIYTRIFKFSGISRKLLESKIKSLHLFQCLVESSNEDMIASVSRYFQDNQIDLSNQTLLPSDVNTLGFFLIRSINKQWEMLNLSNCSIGSIGSKILCDRLSNKESRCMVAIKKVDFSYNHLNFSSLIQLFDLFKSWQTSELIIHDREVLQNHNSSEMYDAVEDAFVSCDYDIQVDFQLESFLFGCGINICPVLLNMISVKYIYFLNCKWMATTTLLNFKLLAKQKLCEIHLINTHLPEKLMKVLCSGLLDTGNSVISSLFIYNPKLSDQDSDKLCHKFVLSDKVVDRVNLIVSNTKIQGIVSTSAIREQLTKLELLNILANINRKCSDQMQTLPWKGNLYYDGSSSDLISFTFIKMLHKITCSKWNWQLRIILREKDVLIAHKVNYRYISEKITVDQPPKAIFLSDCNITGVEHLLLYDTKATLTNLCILNSYIDESWFTRLNINLVLCKEIFIHTLYHINIDGLGFFRKNSSTVLVTKSMILGCNPSTEQMALALQLEPSIDVFKLSKCQRDFDCFRQIVTLLTTNQINWTKLDLVNCYLGEIECEILWNNLKINKDSLSTVQTLKVSSKQLTIPLVADFIKIVLMWKVQQLIFCGINHTVYEYFVTKFKNFCCMNAATNDHDLEEVFLSITYSSKKNIYFCNCSWNHIIGLLESCTGTTLNIFNCCFPMQAKIVNISELSCITKLHIINSNLHENTIVDMLETFVKRKVEISIFNISINVHGKALYNFITSKKFVYRSRLNVVVSMKSFMCGYSTTEDQLYLLQSQKLSDLEESVVALLSDTKSIYDKELFVFQNNQLIALHLVGKVAQEGFLTELTSVLKGTSNL